MALINRWKLDEKTGLFVDSVGAANATMTGPYTRRAGAQRFGVLCLAGDVYATPGDIFNPAAADFTLTAWLRPLSAETSAHEQGICGRQSANPNRGFLWYLTTAGTVRFITSGTGSDYLYGTSTTSVYNFYDDVIFVAIRRTGTGIGFWLNGAADGSGTIHSNIYDNGQDFCLFNQDITTRNFSPEGVVVDDLQRWDEYLGDAALLAMYNEGSAASLTPEIIDRQAVDSSFSFSVASTDTVLKADLDIQLDDGTTVYTGATDTFAAGWNGTGSQATQNGDQVDFTIESESDLFETYNYFFVVTGQDQSANTIDKVLQVTTVTVGAVANSGFEGDGSWQRRGEDPLDLGEILEPGAFWTPPEGIKVATPSGTVDNARGKLTDVQQNIGTGTAAADTFEATLVKGATDIIDLETLVVRKNGAGHGTGALVAQGSSDGRLTAPGGAEYSWYKMDDNAATPAVVDSADEAAYPASIVQGGPNTSDLSAAGKVGTALDFGAAGGNNRVQSASYPAMVTLDPWFTAFWFYPRSTQVNANGLMLIMGGAWPNANRFYWLRASNQIQYQSSSGSRLLTVTPDAWNHVVVAQAADGTDRITYWINGSQIWSDAGWGQSFDAGPWQIGWDGGSNPFDGLIDDMRFYRRRCVQADVSFLWNGGQGTSEPIPRECGSVDIFTGDIKFEEKDLAPSGVYLIEAGESCDVDYTRRYASGEFSWMSDEVLRPDLFNFLSFYRKLSVPASPAIPTGASWLFSVLLNDETLWSRTFVPGDEGTVEEGRLYSPVSIAASDQSQRLLVSAKYDSGKDDKCLYDGGLRSVEGFRAWGLIQRPPQAGDQPVTFDNGTQYVETFQNWGTVQAEAISEAVAPADSYTSSKNKLVRGFTGNTIIRPSANPFTPTWPVSANPGWPTSHPAHIATISIPTVNAPAQPNNPAGVGNEGWDNVYSSDHYGPQLFYYAPGDPDTGKAYLNELGTRIIFKAADAVTPAPTPPPPPPYWENWTQTLAVPAYAHGFANQDLISASKTYPQCGPVIFQVADEATWPSWAVEPGMSIGRTEAGMAVCLKKKLGTTQFLVFGLLTPDKSGNDGNGWLSTLELGLSFSGFNAQNAAVEDHILDVRGQHIVTGTPDADAGTSFMVIWWNQNKDNDATHAVTLVQDKLPNGNYRVWNAKNGTYVSVERSSTYPLAYYQDDQGMGRWFLASSSGYAHRATSEGKDGGANAPLAPVGLSAYAGFYIWETIP